jgi:hypothetical protein
MARSGTVRLLAVVVVFAMVVSTLAVLAAVPRGLIDPSAAGPSGVRPSVSYTVTFSESGLPANLTWQVKLGPSEGSYFTDGGTDYLTFTLGNGNYTYTVTDISGWHQSTLPYTGYVLVSGASVAEPTLSYLPVTYPVVFSESDLPSGQNFSVTVGASNEWLTTDGGTDTLTFQVANGTSAYSIRDISGWHQTSLPYAGNVVIHGAGVTETTLVYHQVTYSISFSEIGLPSGITWQVSVGGNPKSLITNGGTDTLTWTGLPNGTYAYAVTDISGWHQATEPYTGNITLNGSSETEPTLAYAEVMYSVVFSESGLPSGLTWKVTVGAAAESLLTDGGTDTLTFQEGNGTFAYSITDVSGWHQTTMAYTGSVAVNGVGVVEATLVYYQVLYTITFSESGLLVGTNWSVNLSGTPENSTGSSISFTEPNGTYTYTLGIVPGFSPAPASGSVHVTGTSPTVDIVFSQVTYTLKFTESGFPSGTSWSITIGVTTHTSTTTTVTFSEPNGTYSYSVGLVSGYVPVTPSGSVGVNGASVNVPVPFTTVTYSVTFTESGLPHLRPWSVAFGGTRQLSTGTTIVFQVANGTYTYLVAGPAGYQVSVLAPEGTLRVNGASLSQPVLFLRGATTALTFREVGLAHATLWCVKVGSNLCTTGASVVARNLTPATYQYSIESFLGMTTVVKLGPAYVGASGSVIAPPAPTFVVRYSFPVTFTESTLPTGTPWTVTSGGLRNTSTSHSIVLDLVNATYGFTIPRVTGYLASPSIGHYRVSGAPVSISISFVAHAATPRSGAAPAPAVTAALPRLIGLFLRWW